MVGLEGIHTFYSGVVSTHQIGHCLVFCCSAMQWHHDPLLFFLCFAPHNITPTVNSKGQTKLAGNASFLSLTHSLLCCSALFPCGSRLLQSNCAIPLVTPNHRFNWGSKQATQASGSLSQLCIDTYLTVLLGALIHPSNSQPNHQRLINRIASALSNEKWPSLPL